MFMLEVQMLLSGVNSILVPDAFEDVLTVEFYLLTLPDWWLKMKVYKLCTKLTQLLSCPIKTDCFVSSTSKTRL